jgi:hypothetical protein
MRVSTARRFDDAVSSHADRRSRDHLTERIREHTTSDTWLSGHPSKKLLLVGHVRVRQKLRRSAQKVPNKPLNELIPDVTGLICPNLTRAFTTLGKVVPSAGGNVDSAIGGEVMLVIGVESSEVCGEEVFLSSHAVQTARLYQPFLLLGHLVDDVDEGLPSRQTADDEGLLEERLRQIQPETS